MNKPTLIISFDCEGKWGMMDHLTEHHHLNFTNQNINTVYRKLIALLEKYDLVATFAFVGMFTLSVDEYKKNFKLEGLSEVQTKWLQAFYHDEKNNIWDGWLNPSAFEIVKNATIHEIASHGFSHIPLSEKLLSQDVAKYEFENIERISRLKGVTNKTFVFPRNSVGFLNLLEKFGFIGYRGSLARNTSFFAPVLNIVQEFNLWQNAQCHAMKDAPIIEIPPGFMLNWRANIRKHIPIWVTLKHWKSLLNDASESSKVLHLWTHPHNFINGSDQFELFELILREFSKQVSNGNIINMTQQQYCEYILDSKRNS